MGENMKKVAVLFANGFEELEAVGTYAILRRGGLDTDVYALDGQNSTGRFGLTCGPLHSFANLNASQYDALVLPGGPGYELLEKNERVQQLITHFITKGKVVAAICASPTILGRAGYLKGKTYTCFTPMNEDFGGTFTGEYVAVDDNLITGQSAAATVDFGLAIIEKLLGPEKADQVKKSVFYKN